MTSPNRMARVWVYGTYFSQKVSLRNTAHLTNINTKYKEPDLWDVIDKGVVDAVFNRHHGLKYDDFLKYIRRI